MKQTFPYTEANLETQDRRGMKVIVLKTRFEGGDYLEKSGQIITVYHSVSCGTGK